GTGVLTRAIASRLPAPARIIATDLNQPMLNHAQGQSHDSRITWRQADALALPFEDQSFDVVACQFGAMFFPDTVQGTRETRPVLKPAGIFFSNLWDRITETEFADVPTKALATPFPQAPPRFMARIPHGYHDVEKIRVELTAAGFREISVETVDGKSRASSPRDPAIAYCEGTPLRKQRKGRRGDAARGARQQPNSQASALTRPRRGSSRRPGLLMQLAAPHQAPRDVGRLERGAFGR